MTPPNSAAVVDLIEAFRRSKTMFTGVSMGVFDQTPATLQSLASRLKADPDALERLLDGLRALGFLTLEDGEYRNTPVAETYLRPSSPQTLTGYILYSDQVLWPMWGDLEDAIREGTNRWKQTHGLEGALFSHFFQNPEKRRAFLLGMHGFGVASSPRVVAAFDLSRFRRLVDLGGATGHLPMAAVRRYPQLSAAVFDLPEAIETAREFADDSIELIAGDFFTSTLPPADLYCLGRILHDWSEPKIRLLLGRIHDALPPGGGLLIAEKLLLPDKTGPMPALMQSLNMLVCTEGKERTAAEYEALLRTAGFSSVDSRFTGAAVDAMLALKSLT